MAGLDSLGKVAETDVLILGGGVTGLWAAIKAKEHVEKVTIVDKGLRIGAGRPRGQGGAVVGVVRRRPGISPRLHLLL
jgi:succinate dehydrogenase/fumarate reductase flavoprotein subunit